MFTNHGLWASNSVHDFTRYIWKPAHMGFSKTKDGVTSAQIRYKHLIDLSPEKPDFVNKEFKENFFNFA